MERYVNTTASNRNAKMSRLVWFSISIIFFATQPQLSLAAGGNSGQQLYLAHCAGCHGINGKSVIPQAKDFSSAKLITRSDQSLIDITRSGREMMPAFFGILNDNEILAVINYLRTLN